MATKKTWLCFICEKRYAELEEAEVCEQSHATRPRQRERDEDDGRCYSDPRDERERRIHGD